MEENQEKDFMITMKNKILFFLSFSIVFISCENDIQQEYIPDVFVDEQINLSNVEYQVLQNEGGSVNIEGGVKGIIIYRTINDYKAFERNCPYAPNEECAQVEVDISTLFIQCPCCSSQFDFDGNVTSGPSVLPLKQYSTSLNNNFLSILN